MVVGEWKVAMGLRRLSAGLVMLAMLTGCGGSQSTVRPDRGTPRKLAYAADVDGVWFLNPRVGWAMVDNTSRLLATEDGGHSWRDISPPALRQPGRVVAGVGTSGGIGGMAVLTTADLWVPVFNLAVDTLHPVSVWHSSDGGRNWFPAGQFPANDGSAWLTFASPRLGYALISHGQAMGEQPVTVYRTDDGGLTWSAQARTGTSTDPTTGTPGAPYLAGDKTGLRGGARSTLWLSGGDALTPYLLVSTDHGRHWAGVHLPGWNARRGDTFGFCQPPVFTGSAGVLTCSPYPREFIFTTGDNGRRWTPHLPPRPGAVDLESTHTWFVSAGHLLYLTTPAGRRWTAIRTSVGLPDSSYLRSELDFVNLRDGWAITPTPHGSRLWQTTDGGRTWTSQSLPT